VEGGAAVTALQVHRSVRESYAKVEAGAVRLPLSVVVAGNSETVMVVPPRTRRTDGTAGEVLGPMLEESGVGAQVRNIGQWFSTIVDLRRRYEHDLRNHFPDVVVLQFGFVEAQPNVVPTWLSRHLQSWDRSSHPVAVAYHDHLADRAWKSLRRLQRVASSRDWPTYRLSPVRFERELRHVIQMLRDETGCLVLVMDIDACGERVDHWLPGTRQRNEKYQAILHNVTTGFDDNVRLVEHSKTIPLGQLEDFKPDGIHRNAAGHRLTASAIRDEILDWLGR
jgi:lysophospholipase L1-like esterase